MVSPGCIQERDQAAAVQACTADIDSGYLSGVELARALDYRGISLLNLRDDEAALEDFNASIALEPEQSLAYAYRGDIFAQRGLLDLAIRDADRSMKFDPDFADAYQVRGTARSDMGQYSLAILDFNRAIILNPNPASYNGRAWARYEARLDPAAALTDANRAIALSPNEAAYVDTRAHILAATGRPREALKGFEQAMTQGGDGFIELYRSALLAKGYSAGAPGSGYGPDMREALQECLAADCRLMSGYTGPLPS